MVDQEPEEFVVRTTLDSEEIKALISPYAEIDTEEGRFILNEKYFDAEIRVQILVPLLAFQVMKQSGQADSAAIDPVKLTELTTVPIGEAYPIIRELEQEGLIENVGKEYRIAPDKSQQIQSQIDPNTSARLAD